ncbi:DNA-3-methyladenine glycosylase 2 family protein [Nocardioides jishulii]|uniref:DNA-3-methyladenine glycosylase II n=1 Tax=Nocardioides jishulii TaxID=2575440 RepID=A0A4U2YK40_9ACTN|nr:DNA-3-methyladenine glycosylase 2 [Nocardioides jishulii]QCX27017.1 DNA-3-methyladenine glycosylase 2 family protein [Nocardioides jishulii]TKI61499.1 DNA-3-methyladenine glycosylase 2 family protein [Nocardioides jishulii]
MERTLAPLDADGCYRAVSSRDRRFDGVFFTAVHTTGIYCRPSCPARTPHADHVTFHRTAAAAQASGCRACKRCAPDAAPGSPEWDLLADVAGRAMRLIDDGVVDRDGVSGLAARLGYTPRHLGRVLVAELGAGPLALARARRAQTARTLIEESDLQFAAIAFAAGFSSVRQFNETVREVYAASPGELRASRRRTVPVAGPPPAPGRVVVRLPVRTPYAGEALLDFLAQRAVPGIEVVRGATYARSLALPHGPATVEVRLPQEERAGRLAHAVASFALTDLRDLGAATARVRGLLDADCDPVAVGEVLGADPLLADVVRRVPGLRVPGHVDGYEAAVRAVLGQQVTLAGARRLTQQLVAMLGEPIASEVEGLDRLFPAPDALASLPDGALGMPASRHRALRSVAQAVLRGDVVPDRGADRSCVRESMLALDGVGPWTADYVAMRALGEPDAFLPADTGTRAALAQLGEDPARAVEIAERWRPWRSYAQMYLWRSLAAGPHAGTRTGTTEGDD